MQAFLESPLESLLRVSSLLTLLAAGWGMGWGAERSAPRFGMSRVVIAGLTPVVILAALVSGRLATLIPHWRVVLAHPLDLLRINGQVSVFGVGLGAVGALSVLTWWKQLSFPRIADLYGAVVPLAFATYDAGCLVRNDCFGREAPAPLGIRFPGLAVPRYPVELYAAAAALLAYWVLCSIARSADLYPGRVALSALAILGASNALLDPLRLHAEQTTPTLNQMLSLGITVLALIGLIGLRVNRRWNREKQRHKGYIWIFYLAPDVRGRGIGTSLFRTALRYTRALPGLEQLQLSVAAEGRTARSLYASFGFESYGRERRALKLGDRYVDTELMALHLEQTPSG